MADPLSITASALTVLETSSACARILVHIIRGLKNAPAELTALSNEVNDIKVVLYNIKAVCKPTEQGSSLSQEFLDMTSKQLTEAGEILAELEELLKRHIPLSSSSRCSWPLKKGKAGRLHLKLKDLRMNLLAQLTLPAITYLSSLESKTTRILSAIALNPGHFSQLQVSETPPDNSVFNRQVLTESSPKTEYHRSSTTQQSPLTSSGDKVAAAATTLEDSTLREGASSELEHSMLSSVSIPPVHRFASNSIIYFHVYTTGRCRGYCNCTCHSSLRYRTPRFLRNILGSLFVGYSGPPILFSKCSETTCQNHPSRVLEITYCFPEWFLARAMRIAAGITFFGNPIFSFEFRRKIGWGGRDNILRFALTGNVQGVKALLTEGDASLTDVDPNHGRTALHYAVLRNQVAVCEFLLQAGADPYFQDDNGTSASQKAWEQILCKRGTNKELEAFKRFFPSNEALEVWEFTYIHNVVLGVLPLNIGLELQNQQYRAQVNMVDSTGRTPLHWATMRGEEEAVECLLEAGADANVQDDFKNTPLCLAASSGSLHMLERLILAGADVDARNNIGSQAIHYASRHRNDVEPVKVLLRAGASVNSKNNFGHTPLSGAAIKNRHRIGAYLLNHGADTDVSSIHGDTPLFETIMHNSYEFLEILLNKGVCHTRVNAAGSTLFHVAALEADVKTVEILRGARLSGGNPNAKDRNGKTALEISRLRKAAPDGFKEVFERLIDLDHYE